jgi:hypothetical protein
MFLEKDRPLEDFLFGGDAIPITLSADWLPRLQNVGALSSDLPREPEYVPKKARNLVHESVMMLRLTEMVKTVDLVLLPRSASIITYHLNILIFLIPESVNCNCMQ